MGTVGKIFLICLAAEKPPTFGTNTSRMIKSGSFEASSRWLLRHLMSRRIYLDIRTRPEHHTHALVDHYMIVSNN